MRNIASLPHPTGGGLGAVAEGKLLVFGGSDGSLAAREYELRDRHPGFSKIIHQFDPKAGRWSMAGGMPYALVTTGLAIRDNQFVIAGGEDRPS